MRSSRVDTFTLVTLGRLTLVTPSGEQSESLSKRRLKLALLAVLATARRPISRCILTEMFWGDQDESRARHSLSDALSHLRRELGRRAITSQGNEVALSPEAPLIIDAIAFADAVDARDLARAASLYTGPFLDGVDIEAGPSFDQWVSRERRRLETVFFQVCTQQCMALARAREWDQCGALASRWLEAAPLSVDAALYRLNAVKSPGTREAAQRALDEFDALSMRLARDFDLPPEKPVSDLADSIRENMHTLPGERATVAPPDVPSAAVAVRDSTPIALPNVRVQPAPPASLSGPIGRMPGRARRYITRLATGTVAIVAFAAAMAARGRATDASASSRPRVVIAVDVSPGDSATAWLADGLPQMMASELSRSPELDVVPPSQVRALLQRRGDAKRSTEIEDARDLARRLGATYVVSGTIAREDHTLVLDLAVRDAATGRLLQNAAITQRDAATLADAAAARVLTAMNAQRPGFRIADLETSSVDAYEHFVRAMQVGQEGRNGDAVRELDAAIALDSTFLTAVHARLDQALVAQQTDVAARLRDVLRRHDDRASDFDRRRSAITETLYAGEVERTETLARQLVRLYPRDPRAYLVLNGVLAIHGRFAAAEQMWQTALSLDSLSMEAGTGPCTPCMGWGTLSRVQAQLGKLPEAERSARRWVTLQPDAPGSWSTLAWTLAYRQHYREAMQAVQRAISLSPGDPELLDQYARQLVMARQFEAADSLAATWATSPSEALRGTAYDLRVLLARERGQFRESNEAIVQTERVLPNAGVQTVLVQANNLARLGDFDGAERLYERATHGTRPEREDFPPTGTASRGFCWHHALLFDAIAPRGDIRQLQALADTLQVGCAHSFFGRDRVLYHYARGVIAMQQGRWRDAESELQKSRWGVAESWTRTIVELAKARLALDEPQAAIAALREAYATPLDGMGRYQPRTEIDYLMAQAFRRVGTPDSANVYEGYVRRAWQHADPEVKGLLAKL